MDLTVYQFLELIGGRVLPFVVRDNGDITPFMPGDRRLITAEAMRRMVDRMRSRKLDPESLIFQSEDDAREFFIYANKTLDRLEREREAELAKRMPFSVTG